MKQYTTCLSMTNCSFQWQSFPFPWKRAALKTLLQQGSSCQPHLLVETRCFRVQSNKSQLMQVPNGKDTESTRPDSQVSVPSTRPGTWESPAWSWASSPLRKEKEKRKKEITRQRDSVWPVTVNISACEWGGVGKRCSWRDFCRDTTVLGSHPKISSN